LIKKNNFLSLLFVFIGLNIFAQNDSLNRIFFIYEIKITGNFKTKEFVVQRELSFNEGDSISGKNLINEISQSKINLLKTPLFNFVNIDYEIVENKNVIISINLSERWYLWPELAFYYADRNFSNWLKEWNFNHLDYGGGAVKYNFRGRNEKIELYKIFGYNRLFIFNYENIFIDKKRQNSLSFSFTRLNRKETSYVVENDKVKWLRLEDDFVLSTYKVFADYNFRKKISLKHSLILGYGNKIANDTVFKLNPNYFINTQIPLNYLFLTYTFSYDKRDSRIYPLTGLHAVFIADKTGLLFFKDTKVNNLSLTASFSKFMKIGKKIYLSDNIVLRKNIGDNSAFFLNEALGYDFNIRGFEYNVINGTDFILQKNTLNFEIFSKRNFNIKFIPYKSISKTHLTVYFSAFTDFAYVVNKDSYYNSINSLANKFLFSYGAGINFLTYYDKMLSLEFSKTNSRNFGFFIHFECPF